jgi:signal transduction histidine kinase
MPDPDQQALFCSSAWYTSTEELAGFREFSKNYSFPLGVGLPGKVWAEKKYVWIKDVTKDPEFLRREIAREARLTSAVGIPLLAGSEVIAVMVFFIYQPREEDEHFVKLGSEIALQLGELFKRKKAEEELQRLNLELEQRINERTAQLEDKNRELEAFAYSVSHDLKAPLRGIDGYSRLLLTEHATALNEEGRTFLKTIRHSTEQMNNLIDDLLNYSRLEQRAWQSKVLNIRSFTVTAAAEFENEVQSNGGTIAVELPVLNVVADPGGLALVLRNLFDNAVKYSSSKKSPQIKVTGYADKDFFIIEVRDNGIGFDMKYHDRIFGIFNRLHPEGEYSGTGIGLAMVKKAMERIDGQVWAKSAPDQGSTFCLALPLYKGQTGNDGKDEELK